MPVAVFDLDGTLVASMEDLVASLNVVLDHLDLQPVEAAAMRPFVGSGARVLIQKGLEANDRSWTAKEVETLLPRFLDHYEKTFTLHTRPFDGALAALDTLKAQDWRLAVCTNKSARLTHPLLDALDLTRYFDAVVAGDNFSKPKPDPEPLLGAIDRAGGSVPGSVMIGDTKTDIDVARAVGIPAIAVDFGYSPVPVEDLEPDAVISHFNDLSSAMDRLSLRHLDG